MGQSKLPSVSGNNIVWLVKILTFILMLYFENWNSKTSLFQSLNLRFLLHHKLNGIYTMF